MNPKVKNILKRFAIATAVGGLAIGAVEATQDNFAYSVEGECFLHSQSDHSTRHYISNQNPVPIRGLQTTIVHDDNLRVLFRRCVDDARQNPDVSSITLQYTQFTTVNSERPFGTRIDYKDIALPTRGNFNQAYLDAGQFGNSANMAKANIAQGRFPNFYNSTPR